MTDGERAGLMLSADADGCAPAKFWEPQYKGSFPAEVGSLFPWASDRADGHAEVEVPTPLNTWLAHEPSQAPEFKPGLVAAFVRVKKSQS
jgi:hypothetical protein